jgi:hypothetical protein
MYGMCLKVLGCCNASLGSSVPVEGCGGFDFPCFKKHSIAGISAFYDSLVDKTHSGSGDQERVLMML